MDLASKMLILKSLRSTDRAGSVTLLRLLQRDRDLTVLQIPTTATMILRPCACNIDSLHARGFFRWDIASNTPKSSTSVLCLSAIMLKECLVFKRENSIDAPITLPDDLKIYEQPIRRAIEIRQQSTVFIRPISVKTEIYRFTQQ